MAFKSADEQFIRQHSPIRFLARDNFVEGSKKLRKKFLDACFNFGAGNVFGLVEVNAKIKFLHPSLQKRFVPFFRIEQNESIYIPSEEKFCASTRSFMKGISDQIRIVSV